MSTTTEIAQKLLKSGILKTPEVFTLADLFRIRDALEVLKKYGVADLGLLEEVLDFIQTKVREK